MNDNIDFNSVLVYDVVTDRARYLAPHFQVYEFASKDGARAVFIHPLIPAVCEEVRLKNGAFAPNSAYRTPAHNKAVGGVANSNHVYGKAVDIPAKKLTPRALYDLLCEKYPDSMEIGLYSWGVHFAVQAKKSRFTG